MPCATSRRRFPELIALFLVIAGCQDTGDGFPSVERADSVGVEVVTSTSEDRPLEWAFEPLFTLGGEPEGPKSFFRVVESWVAGDGAGNIHILNPQAHHVSIFSPNGDFLRSMGAEGDGPGELSAPDRLTVSSDGVVSVFDLGKGALVKWDGDGAVLSQVSFPYFPLPNRRRYFASVGDALAVAVAGRYFQIPSPEGSAVDVLVSLTESSSEPVVLTESVRPRGQMVMYEECGIGLNLAPLFSPEIIFHGVGERLAFNAVAAYQIDLIEKGRKNRIVRRAFPLRTSSRELAIQELGEGMNMGRGDGTRCRIPPEDMADRRGFAERIPAVNDIMLSPTGELWVERKIVGPDVHGPIDVFDATGAYVGTLPEGTSFPVLLLPDDRVAFVVTDDLDIDRLVVMRIQR